MDEITHNKEIAAKVASLYSQDPEKENCCRAMNALSPAADGLYGALAHHIGEEIESGRLSLPEVFATIDLLNKVRAVMERIYKENF